MNRAKINSIKQPRLTVVCLMVLNYGWLLVAALLMAGCQEPMPRSFTIEMPSVPEASPPPITLQVGDVLELTFYRQQRFDGPYQLNVHDRISVRVQNRSDLDHTSVILPDGTFTLPLLGTVALGGKTIAEAQELVNQRFADHLEAPVANVLVLEPDGRLEKFFSLLADSSRGSVRRITVAEDRMLPCPYIEPIVVEGKTLSQVRTLVREAYQAQIPGLRVSVALTDRINGQIAIFGEVQRSNTYELEGRMTPFQAVARAGGLTDRAFMEQVLLIRPQADRNLLVEVLNFEEALEGKDSRVWQMTLLPRDTLFVPRSPIANVNVFVEQYIRGILPFDVGAGFVIPVWNTDDD